MPRKSKKGMPVKPVELWFPKGPVDRRVPGQMTPGGLDSMFRQLKKVVIERALGVEMTEHLGYGAGEAKPGGGTDSRNGASRKTVGRSPRRFPRRRCRPASCI